MITPFEDLIRELGTTLGIPLHLDAHGACCLMINEKMRLQIEPDKKGENLVIVAYMGQLNPGKFREEALKEALKANTHFVISGNTGAILGYSGHHNQLSCHTFVPFDGLTVEKLLPALTYLTEYSLSWMDSLLAGQTAPPGLQPRPPAMTPFGIRP